MNRTRLISVILISLNLILLSSCKNLVSQDRGDMTPYQICNDLKRSIMYYQQGVNHEVQWSSPGKRAELLRDFQRFNCRERLEHPEQYQ